MRSLVSTVILLLSMAANASAQNAPADSPPVLTVENAISEAQQNNRQIKISDQNVLFANDQVLAARTQRYPQFNVQLTGSGLLTANPCGCPKGRVRPNRYLASAI
jgi:outer membrane protein TolC